MFKAIFTGTLLWTRFLHILMPNTIHTGKYSTLFYVEYNLFIITALISKILIRFVHQWNSLFGHFYWLLSSFTMLQKWKKICLYVCLHYYLKRLKSKRLFEPVCLNQRFWNFSFTPHIDTSLVPYHLKKPRSPIDILPFEINSRASSENCTFFHFLQNCAFLSLH